MATLNHSVGPILHGKSDEHMLLCHVTYLPHREKNFQNLFHTNSYPVKKATPKNYHMSHLNVNGGLRRCCL